MTPLPLTRDELRALITAASAVMEHPDQVAKKFPNAKDRMAAYRAYQKLQETYQNAK